MRGYAPLSDIAKCSFADANYQCDLKPGHVNEIKKFFNDGEYLFFPEIILSVHLDVDYGKAGAPDRDPFQLIQAREPFRSNTNGLDIKPRKGRSSSDLTRYEISVPEGAKLFKRIDGNHRLSAFEAMEDIEFARFEAPFCIVFFPSREARRNEKALFHNINSKALPLTSEEVLKGIVDAPEDFSDSDLRERFGREYLQCRQLKGRLNFSYLSNLKRVFGKCDSQDECVRSVLIQTLQDLHRQNTPNLKIDTEVVFEAVKRINETYGDPRLQSSTAQGLFAAFLFYHLADNRSVGTYAQYTNWVLRTHQYELRSINADDLIKVFSKIAQSRNRQVFVSIQFSEDTKSNFEAIESAIRGLNEKHHLDIGVTLIRIDQFDTGFSYEINAEILRLIQDSGLLIADLTLGNKKNLP